MHIITDPIELIGLGTVGDSNDCTEDKLFICKLHKQLLYKRLYQTSGDGRVEIAKQLAYIVRAQRILESATNQCPLPSATQDNKYPLHYFSREPTISDLPLKQIPVHLSPREPGSTPQEPSAFCDRPDSFFRRLGKFEVDLEEAIQNLALLESRMTGRIRRIDVLSTTRKATTASPVKRLGQPWNIRSSEFLGSDPRESSSKMISLMNRNELHALIDHYRIPLPESGHSWDVFSTRDIRDHVLSRFSYNQSYVDA